MPINNLTFDTENCFYPSDEYAICPDCDCRMEFIGERATEPYGYFVEEWQCPKCNKIMEVK